MDIPVEGFSKWTKAEKLDWIAQQLAPDSTNSKKLLESYWHTDPKVQRLHEEFIENTLSNFYFPFAVAPNFLIDGKLHTLPMAIEESSVVAAASKAAKFWLDRGGFKTWVLGTEKVGQVHFFFHGDTKKLEGFFKLLKPQLLERVSTLTASMEKRGGGITDIRLRDMGHALKGYHQLHCTFETLDAMGANFINSCLEAFAQCLREKALAHEAFTEEEKNLEVVMGILSNYVPDCLVRAQVSCPVRDLAQHGMSGEEFARKFSQAVRMAQVEPYRAVTHNKGIMNGVDAVVVATGNDFRAVEAGVHAYASRNGAYTSLSHVKTENGLFTFWLDLPLALGTVGGLTALHPMAKLALEILQRPSAPELMRIVAVAGLAQNFAALRSLVTTGIQKGHMKMHLLNILNQLGADEGEKQKLLEHFKKNRVTHASVKEGLELLRAGS